MLDMGFADAIKKIIQHIRKDLTDEKDFQRILLSATPTTGLPSHLYSQPLANWTLCSSE